MHVLFYEYVEDIAAKREPHRPLHLQILNDLHAKGIVRLAGALVEPLDSAVIIFATEHPGVVEEFVKADPYVQNGLVTKWTVRRWNVVVGDAPGR